MVRGDAFLKVDGDEHRDLAIDSASHARSPVAEIYALRGNGLRPAAEFLGGLLTTPVARSPSRSHGAVSAERYGLAGNCPRQWEIYGDGAA